ncbi:type II toxin-antitoxin system SpoIISA family toxin [Metabacillus herbersteinensis]|uniref:Type II toxin-antitoxin system SpoIISA family toxin n=1 Tax=Metabacillus herbersteinensis TaxID=283816 RepID=A0ABV6GIA8_9BACI
MAFKFFIGSLLVFAILNLIFFLVSPLRYHLSLRSIRKVLYTLFFAAVSLGLMFDQIVLSNWPFILTLASIVIFMDLTLLLTPSIMKIWNTEFQYSDYVENVIDKNEKIQQGTMRRVGTMSEMIQNAGEYFSGIAIPNTAKEESDQLENYLSTYSNQYGFLVQLWDVEWGKSDESKEEEDLIDLTLENLTEEEEELAFLEGIDEVLTRIERLNSFDLGIERESYITSLSQSEIISLIKEDSMIVPVFMNEKNLFVVLKNQKGTLLEVDAVHITNLIYLYHSFN